MTGRTLCAARADFPEIWRAEVHAALREAEGIRPAAKVLGISSRTLHRWLLACPELAAGVALEPSRNPALRKKIAST